MYCRVFARRQIKLLANLLHIQHYSVQRVLFRKSYRSFTRLTRKIECVIPFTTQNRALSLTGSQTSDAAPTDRLQEEESDLDIISKHLPLRILYAEPLDSFMQELNASKDVEQLFAIITARQLNDELTREQSVQSVLVLWSLLVLSDDKQHGRKPILAPPGSELLLLALNKHLDDMTIDELSCCYLYLRKMQMPNTHPTIAALLLRSLDIVQQQRQRLHEQSQLISLPALSRLLVAISIGKEFHVPMVCRHFMPHLVEHASNCNTHENARLLAISFLHLQPLVCGDVLEAFKQRLSQLLADGVFHGSDAGQSRALVKLVHMLNLPAWSVRNTALLRDLLYALEPHLPLLSVQDLKMVYRTFQYHLEPANLATALAKATERQLQADRHITSDTLSCYIPFVEPRQRDALVDTFKRLLYSGETWTQPHAAGNLFNILRGLKIADVRVCDAYWLNVLRILDKPPMGGVESDDDGGGAYGGDTISNCAAFLPHCHRYMNFNNNLGGTYRHEELEQRLSQLAVRAIDTTIAGRLPAKFSRLAAFVIAYGHTPHSWKKFPNLLLSGIIGMANQFSIADCFVLSRGVQIALELRFRRQTPSLLGMQLSVIDGILVNCAERHLSEIEADNFTDLNLIVRTLAIRKSLKSTLVYQNAFNKYNELDYTATSMNSRIIRDLCYNLNTSGFIIPRALDAMFEHINRNHEHITGDTVEKVLSCSYNLGYMPQSIEALSQAANILQRDFEFMSGLSLVQSCLALGYFKILPEELVNKVFCVQFIKRIEEEIQACYSKATYPSRVQNVVMQLNRTVCLDLPEANVPWFQQNYLEAQLSKKRLPLDNFNAEVKQLLTTMFKSETLFRCNHTTPYGYQIDFAVHFDRDRQAITAPVETTMLDRITKVAILLLRLDSFCENDLTALRGSESLKMKHLEMMGYKVLHINEHDWNSKYMNAPGAKANYLKCLLQISN